jgi:hypothetical protein
VIVLIAWEIRPTRAGRVPHEFHRGPQQALGHNSKAVLHAYSKHAEVTVPSLDDWEKEWRKAESGGQKTENRPRTEDRGQKSEGGGQGQVQMPKPAVVQVDFKARELARSTSATRPLLRLGRTVAEGGPLAALSRVEC